VGKPAIHQPLLQERDIQIILMAYRYNGMIIETIKKRFWSTATSKATYYQRIHALINAGYLKAIKTTNPYGGYYGVLWLVHGPRARAVIADALRLPISQIPFGSRSISPLRVAHSTLINELRVCLELAQEHYPTLTSLQWYPESYFKASPLIIQAGPTAKERTLEPDSAFSIQIPQGRLSAFVEADRGTITSHQDLRARFRDYLLFTRTLKTPRPVLWVVPTENRIKLLESLALQAAAELKEDATIFFLTTRGKVTEHSLLFQPIWKVVAGPSQKALVEDPQNLWQHSNPLNT
jgi:hypothetical protein